MDIFTTGAACLTVPVNGIGVMGKGLAYDFACRWPALELHYMRACVANRLLPGNVDIWRSKQAGLPDVLLFPTKGHWRNPSRLEHIEAGLADFARKHRQWGLVSIAFPLLGCGLGALSPAKVLPVMRRLLEPLWLDVTICLPAHLSVAEARHYCQLP